MSRYSYEGTFKNPTEGFYVKGVVNDDGSEHWEIWIREERAADGSCPPDRQHSKKEKFDDPEVAHDFILGTAEFFERDYESYVEENHYAIAQMERYEMFKREQ
jgi:hypothetical protein